MSRSLRLTPRTRPRVDWKKNADMGASDPSSQKFLTAALNLVVLSVCQRISERINTRGISASAIAHFFAFEHAHILTVTFAKLRSLLMWWCVRAMDIQLSILVPAPR